ncbi:hypothetical protein CW700_01640 [Candidatus Bathyarchaeota archaeon]|nr:MAG: hypothetical protein CW700_01640 [Candidatus Bathyarchaeota archaeon]
MNQGKPYDHVRFTWWHNHDPLKLVERLKGEFNPTLHRWPPAHATSPFAGGWEIRVRADTLSASLFAWKAHLFQRDRAPFTKKDLRLREIVFSLYPRTRPNPLPWLFTHEPPFEVEEE